MAGFRNKSSRLRLFLINGTLMTVVSLTIRFVAVSFNAYLSKKIGAAALGLFTLISTVYGFALTVATSGVNLATTKLVSEALGNKNISIKRIMKKSIGYAVFFSSVAGIVLFLFAPLIGERILNDPRTVFSLKLLAFTLPPIALSSAMSGYFTAVRKVSKNAIVQVINQGIRISVCIFLLNIFLTDDLESGCLAIVLSGVVAEFLSFFVHGVLYIIEKKEDSVGVTQLKTGDTLCRVALPIAFSAYVRSTLVTIEHILIPRGLEKSGASKDVSLASYGTLHSMVFPLVLFPSAISSSFAGLLIPEVAESMAAGDRERIDRIIMKVFRTVLSFSICVAGVMMCFGYEIGNIVYPDAENAGRYIIAVAPLIPVMYIDTSVDSMLKGLGEQMYCMVVNIIDSSLSVLLVIFLLPRYGIMGYIITVYFTEIVNATLSITRLLVVANVKSDVFSWIVKPLLAVISSTCISRWFFGMLGHYDVDKVTLFYHIGFTLVLYILILTIIWRIGTKDKKGYRCPEI